jgi:pimeloyl-ACP methyl ester carboxylesterase
MTTFVLIHGAWLGTWAWRGVAQHLTAAGHDVYAPTLTGLGMRSHLARPEIDLETHVMDIVNLIVFEDLTEVAVVGHSYGGMVAGSVPHRIPERIARVIYLDAGVPTDGKSMFDEGGPQYREYVEAAARAGGEGWRWPLPDFDEMRQFVSLDGLDEGMLAEFRRKAVAQPIEPFSQPARLGNAEAADIPRAYILCTAGAGPEPPYVEDARARRNGWVHYAELPTGHWPMLSMPRETAEALIAATA